MKIALVMMAEEAQRQPTALAHFLKRSALPAVDYQCWIVPGQPFAEPVLRALEQQYRQHPVDLLLFPAGWQGAEWATRLAWRLNGDALCDVLLGEFIKGNTVTKKACGGAVYAELPLRASPWCLSVAAVPENSALLPDMPVHALTVDNEAPAWLVDCQRVTHHAVSELAQAKHILAVGRGAASVQNMSRLEAIASAAGMALGASREAVMHAWCPMDRLIGMSGTQVAPDICIVAGASGASAFMSGIVHSQLIVAINNDPHAPIFQQADVGIVDELMPVLDALRECITADI